MFTFSSGQSGKTLLISIPVILLLVAFLILPGGCTGEEEEAEPETDPAPEEEELLDEPGQAVRSGRLTLFSDDGTSRWLVSSERAVRREAGEDVTFEPITADVYLGEDLEAEGEAPDPEKKPDYIMEGELGRYIMQEGRLEFPGSSTIMSDRLRFVSSDLVWEQEENIIRSDRDTEIEGENFTARGSSFSAPASLKSFSLYGEEERPARIRWKEDNFD